MKKITLLISSIILFFFINGCAGYEPIFSSTNLQFEIADYSIKGDKTLGGKIYSKLHDISKNNKNNQDAKNIELFINVTKTKDSTSKDTSGKILEYKITLNVEVEIQDFITSDEILNQTFTSSTAYKVQSQYSDTIKLENKSIEDLINKIYQELLIKLSQSIGT